MQETFKFSGIFTLVQAELGLLMFVFFHKPPLTPAAITVSLVASLKRNSNARVRPPTLLGPLSTHILSVASPGILPDVNSRALSASNFLRKMAIFSGVGLPRAGFMVSSHSCS